jgi:hypothetical protein
MKQSALTIVVPIDPPHADELDQMIAAIGANVTRQTVIPFADLDLLHFASWVVFRSQQFGPQLIFESNFDGDARQFLAQFVARARAGLDQICQFTPGYPREGSAEDVQRFLLSKSHENDTFYVGCVGLSRNRILQEAQLRERIEDFLDTLPRTGLDPVAIRSRVQEFVRRTPDLAWAQEPPDDPTLADRVTFWTPPVVAMAAVAAIVWWTGWVEVVVTLAVAAAVVAIVLRQHEQADVPADIAQADPGHVQRLVSREDHRPQNHLASITRVKPGFFRFGLLKSVLAIINLAGRYYYNKGKLGGIPSIHFARWSVFNGGTELLFLSNFDGSWEHYLGEFIDQAAGGLTAVWSNSVGFPRTRWLTGEGARDEQKFKAFARSSQTYTQLWYSAYPYLTISNILNNKAIREQLWGDLDRASLLGWLRRF